tara:strand:- start:265 stop:1017 length:753 start_codon:yes stop_codon:yes gene_type:complete
MGSKFKDEYYVTVYELARSGMSENKMSKNLGVSTVTLRSWKKKNKALRDAIDRGRNSKGKMTTQKWFDYVYQKLPANLMKIWDEIQDLEAQPNGIQKIESLLETNGKRARQHIFLHALVTANFNVSRACSVCNIPRRTFENWVTNEPDFSELMNEINVHKKNFFEASLVGLVARGDSAATIFVNRTYNRDRGYNEKVDVNVIGKIEHEHVHAHISIDELELGLEVRTDILKAIRKRNQDTIEQDQRDVFK